MNKEEIEKIKKGITDNRIMLRIWDLDKRKMIYRWDEEAEWLLLKLDEGVYNIKEMEECKRRYIVMQCFNLLDKNRKEIYVGDIIKGKNHTIILNHIRQVIPDDIYEFIGNIYENENLMLNKE